MSHEIFNLLVVGDIYTETQYIVERIPSPNEFSIADEADTTFGSKTLNATRILTRLGDDVTFMANVGRDNEGDNFINYLAKLKVIPLVEKIPESRTGKISVITNSKGLSSIVLYPGANTTIDNESIKKIRGVIEKSAAVYTGTHLPLESLYKLVEMCKEAHKLILVDVPNQHNVVNLSKLSSVTFFMPNREEAELLTNHTINDFNSAYKTLQQLRKHIKGTIIITLDKDGCVFLENDQDQPRQVRTTEVKPVDTTAAGDIFRAVFLHYFLQTNSINDSLIKALSIATKSVNIKGVNATISTLELY